mgnify:CR=1 FL=1
MSALIEFDEVCKYYQMGDTLVKAADHISMKIDRGEFVAIVGQSGSGKSTCMNIIGCLDVPTAGSYRLNGRDVGKMNRDELADVRNEMLGFIFQQYNLLPRLNLLENVEVPLIYAGVPKAERMKRAAAALDKVGLSDRMNFIPNQLSGGQKQRVAIAGVVAMEPKCIIMDEPTAMLDPNGRKEVLNTVHRLNRQKGVTVILITHYMEEVVHADKVYVMDNGEVVMQGTPREIFSQVETLKEYRLDVPQVTLLAHELHKAGVDVPEGILTTEELVNALCQ